MEKGYGFLLNTGIKYSLVPTRRQNFSKQYSQEPNSCSDVPICPLKVDSLSDLEKFERIEPDSIRTPNLIEIYGIVINPFQKDFGKLSVKDSSSDLLYDIFISDEVKKIPDPGEIKPGTMIKAAGSLFYNSKNTSPDHSSYYLFVNTKEDYHSLIYKYNPSKEYSESILSYHGSNTNKNVVDSIYNKYTEKYPEHVFTSHFFIQLDTLITDLVHFTRKYFKDLGFYPIRIPIFTDYIMDPDSMLMADIINETNLPYIVEDLKDDLIRLPSKLEKDSDLLRDFIKLNDLDISDLKEELTILSRRLKKDSDLLNDFINLYKSDISELKEESTFLSIRLHEDLDLVKEALGHLGIVEDNTKNNKLISKLESLKFHDSFKQHMAALKEELTILSKNLEEDCSLIDKFLYLLKSDRTEFKKYLTRSSRFELESVVPILDKAYSFHEAFRPETSEPKERLSTFNMIQVVVNGTTNESLINIVEKFIQNCASYLLEDRMETVEYLSKRIPNLIEHLELLSNIRFKRMTYDDAIKLLNDMKRSNPEKYTFQDIVWGEGLLSCHHRALMDYFDNKEILAITNYPELLEYFYMKNSPKNSNDINSKSTVENFDIIAPFGCEIAGGSVTERDIEILKSKMKRQGVSNEFYERYLKMARRRLHPVGGFGMGFERLAMFLLMIDDIRAITPLHRRSTIVHDQN